MYGIQQSMMKVGLSNMKSKWTIEIVRSDDVNVHFSFHSYDSVDQALLDQPHKIRGCQIEIEKSDAGLTSRFSTPTRSISSSQSSLAKTVKISMSSSNLLSSVEFIVLT